MIYIYGNDKEYHKINTNIIFIPILLFIILISITIIEKQYTKKYYETYNQVIDCVTNKIENLTTKNKKIYNNAVIYACFGTSEIFCINKVYYYETDDEIYWTFEYNDSIEDYQNKLNEYNQIIDDIVKQIPNNLKDKEIIKWVHDYLCDNYSYGNDASAYNMLKTGKGVCEAYTKLFSSILEKKNIEVHHIRSNKMNHAWNLVKLNNKWLHIDVTWDDTTSSNKYYLLTDHEMNNSDHYGWVDVSSTTLKLDQFKVLIFYIFLPIWIIIVLSIIIYLIYLKYFIKEKTPIENTTNQQDIEKENSSGLN